VSPFAQGFQSLLPPSLKHSYSTKVAGVRAAYSSASDQCLLHLKGGAGHLRRKGEKRQSAQSALVNGRLN